MNVVTVRGMAGVGKTRLVVRAAHELVLRGRFAEVQLWADLHGRDLDRSPADAGVVLDGFLRALGVAAEQIPMESEHRAALYRSCLAGKSAMVVLDDAADEDQVRPLLPGSPGSLVLITSRNSLAGLEGARPLTLEELPVGEAIDLLSRIVGPERVAADPRAAVQIVEACGRLPGAIASSARLLQCRPAWALRRVLRHLDADDGSVHAASFDASYYGLPEHHRHIFQMIGQHSGEDLTATSAAALAGVPVGEAEAVLESLLDKHLVRQVTTPRYRLHPLVRKYARSLAGRNESEPQRYAAFSRLVADYLSTAAQATKPRKAADCETAGRLREMLASGFRTGERRG